MRERLTIAPRSAPRLAACARLRRDEARQRWVLLAPERLLLPDETALAILQRLDGVATVEAIAAELAARYEAPEGQVRQDVIALLQGLADKGYVAP